MTFLLSCTLQKDDASYLADVFADWFDQEFPVAAIEERAGTDRVLRVYFEHQPADSAIKHMLDAHGYRELPFTMERLPDRDWVAESLAGLHPIEAGRYYIHGSHDTAKFSGHRWSIEIDAGQAFGTGHHATTAGCLEALDSCLKKRSYRRPIDVGCGTGVLAIAIARTLLCPVIASDIDPIATAITMENAGINQVGVWVRAITATGFHNAEIKSRAPYDLLVANILAKPLMGLARDLASLATPGATIILSGIMQHQAAAVVARYRQADCRLVRQLAHQEWRTLILQRN